MLPLVKKVIPGSIKDKIKSINRDRLLDAAMNQLAAVSPNQAPDRDVLTELAHAWGEDGYRAAGGYLEEVARWATEAKGPVLEIGSGLTTLILGSVLGRRGLPIWTLEHHPDYFANTEARLKRYNLTNVQLTLAPLRDYGEYCWYDPPLAELPRNFGLIVADGPPGDVKGGRFGLLPVLGSHFASDAVVLLDDAERPKEKAVLQKWGSEYGLSHQSHARDGKAWAICTFSHQTS